MPDVRYWKDEKARQALLEKGRQALARIQGELADQNGVVAIEPESGVYWVGRTLGKANDAAYVHCPDCWLYFCRLDDPGAEMLLPTW
jgi:hypothetical protein